MVKVKRIETVEQLEKRSVRAFGILENLKLVKKLEAHAIGNFEGALVVRKAGVWYDLKSKGNDEYELAELRTDFDYKEA